MIQLPTKTELKELEDFKSPPCLTIYAPYIQPGQSGNNPNRIQLKNHLKESRRLLAAKSMNERDITKFLQPIINLIDGGEFNSDNKSSLAIFVGKDFFRIYHLPSDEAKNLVIVDKNFKLLPILKLTKKNLKYYILHVSYNGVKLLKGDAYHIKKLKFLKSETVKEDLNIDELPSERQLHMVSAVDSGRKSERYHGQYNESDTNKDMLIRYFRKVDHKLNRQIKNHKTPLIIAGVDYLLPLYRQINTYPTLVEDDIEGNLEYKPLDFIREQACKLFGKNK